MAIEMVRVPSETPNINNVDDFVGLRYAYGNQNGYVQNKGNECSYSINGSTFKINSGRIVLQGVECDIDATGSEIVIDNVASKQYYTIYLQVNLAVNEVKILASADTNNYPAISDGDDLTQNNIGIANLELYHFDATAGVISNVKKLVTGIEYVSSALKGYDSSKGTVEQRLQPLNNYDENKGTIEERLTNLGFKQGTIVINPATVPPDTFTGYVYRQGNYVKGELVVTKLISSQFASGTWTIATIPENFRPIEDKHIFGYAVSDSDMMSLDIKSSGEIVITSQKSFSFLGGITFGYEASPVE